MNDQWTDRLSEYVDGELAAGERTALEAHLATCAECRATLEELRRVVPVVEALVAEGARVSIDTRKPGVAKAAVAPGLHHELRPAASGG